MAILGYIIVPDKTEDCDRQNVRIKLESPGFSSRFIILDENPDAPKRNFLARIFLGKKPNGKRLPFTNYQDNGDTLDLTLVGNETFLYKKPHGFQVENQISEQTYLLGTDNFGRDIFSRLILGARISLLVGLIAVFISLTIGIFLGAIAGYFGGKWDDFIMFIVNTVWSIPTLLLVFAIVLAFGRGIGIIFLAVGLTMWVDVARIVRGQILSVKEMQFVEAAKAFGMNHFRILFKHILPNVLGPVMVVAAANFATAILLEAGLGYLGFGVQPPTPSWGTMLNENYGFAISGRPMLALIPAFAVMSLVLSFNLVGNGLRDALDVRMPGKK